MPPQYNRVPEIRLIPEDTAGVIDAVNNAIRVINEIFTEVSVSDSQFRGNDGFIPQFNNDVNLAEFSLRNVARSREAGDAVTRRELEEIGILGNVSGIVFTQDVTFAEGASSTAGLGGTNSLITEDESADLINGIVDAALEENVAASVDGQDVVVQHPDGQLGTTKGSLLQGIDGGNQARFARLSGTDLKVVDEDLKAIILILIKEIQELKQILTD